MSDERDTKPENVPLGIDGQPLEVGTLFGKAVSPERLARAQDRIAALSPVRDAIAALHERAEARKFKSIGASRDFAAGEACGLELALKRLGVAIDAEQRVLAPKGRVR